MSMKGRLAALASMALTLAAVTAFTIVPAAPAASPATGGVTVPINLSTTCPATAPTSTLCTAAGQTLNFVGTATVTNFSVVNGALTAAGTYAGTLTNTATMATAPVSGSFTGAPVTGGGGSCQILDLTIGPIHLDLLGLVVDTNAIHLNITAQQGPGNLLGNLLCSVAHLLDNSGSPTALQQIANLLNQILGRL
jgi:hypothetical protein